MEKIKSDAPLEYVENTIFNNEDIGGSIIGVSWKVNSDLVDGTIVVNIKASMNYDVDNIFGKTNFPKKEIVQTFNVSSFSSSKLKTGDIKISFTGEFGTFEKIYGVKWFVENTIFEQVKNYVVKEKHSLNFSGTGVKLAKINVDTDKEIYKISFIICKK